MQKKTFLLLAILICWGSLFAQSGGIISGIVKDQNSVSLPGATLTLDKYNRYTISDQNGYFEFLNVPAGTYQVEVSYIGFQKTGVTVNVGSGNNTVQNIILQEGAVQGKEVVVMGEMLRGQAKALNQQKTNSNISNVISSDQVGRFPDANIGDALKRVPGITMQTDQGEARNIIIRGLAPELNSVTLNGNRIPSAEGDNRNVQMDLIPSEMISNIEVSKTLTPDMDADAIGGSVDLVTRATPNKQRISATISGGYVPIREKAMYSGSFVYGNRFFENKLGVVVSGSLQNKDYGSDNIEAVWKEDEFNPGSKYVPGTFASASYLGGLNLKDASQFEESPVPLEYLAINYHAKEQIVGGYLRWDQNITNDFLVIVGVRAENTHIDYTGNKMLEADDEITAEKVSRTNSYFNLFPSLTVKYNVAENLVLRGAYTTSIARPNYYSLVPYTNISQSNEEISIGNPDLKATYAHNFDLSGEYYFKSVGLISAGVFYKNLKNFIYKYTNISYTADNFAADFPDIPSPIPADKDWVYSEYRNGKGVDVFGLELAVQRKLDFLPGAFLKNFAVYLNYTYTWSQTKGIWDSEGNERKDISLPGTAPHMFNASLSWENKKFSARASLNFTSDYIDALGGSAFEDSYYDKQLFLDVNASYKITPQFRIFAEANNLTNQPLRYYQGEKNRVMQLEYYQPVFNMGLKYDF